MRMLMVNWSGIQAATKHKLIALFKYIRNHPVKAFAFAIAVGIAAIVLLFMLTLVGAFGHVPGKSALAQLENPITSTIYGSDNKPIGVYYLQNRSNVDSNELNPYLIKALIATEDVRFYEHAGIDYKSYGRVFIKSILMQQGKGGGSTITQQIAKNLYGRKDIWLIGTPISKFRELIIASRLEDIYSKEEILLLYFNTVSFGENLYGIEMAAQRYFSKTPAQLSLAESATLVGVLKATSFYNPRKNPENAEKRRNVVLQQMVKNQSITQQEADDAKKPLQLNYSAPVKTSSLSGYYKDFIRQEFDAWAKDNPGPNGEIYQLEVDGLQVYTTLQPNIQKYAENAMTRTMDRLQALMNKHWESKTTEGGKNALIAKLVAQEPRVRNLREKGQSEDYIETFVSLVKPRNYWEIGKGFELKDASIRDSLIHDIIRLHTGILALNSNSGAILGYVGGIDYGFSQIDNILTSKQVGSTFKPITYLTALEQGVEACDFYDNSLRTYKEYEDWKPRNANNSYGGSYSVHGALANSVNTVAVSLQLKAGVKQVKAMAEKMGITSPIPDVPSIVLGTADISLFEMVSAYASISNGGNKVKPFIIRKITDQEGNVLFEQKPAYEGRVASEQSIKTLQQMMSEVLTEGTGKVIAAYEIPYRLIGKTGTTQNNGDGWFIGSSPEVVVGAWVGTQDKRVHFESTYLGSGANTALPMVASVFKGLSSWTRPMISSFEFEPTFFPCPMYSDSTAAYATEYYKNDSAYLRELIVLDTNSISLDTTPDSIPATLAVPTEAQEQ